MLKVGILFRIKDGIDMLIDRANPNRVVQVDDPCNVKEFLPRSIIGYLCYLHPFSPASNAIMISISLFHIDLVDQIPVFLSDIFPFHLQGG